MLTKGNIKYTYNAGNQLVSDGVDTYAYDKNGNLTQKGDTKYTYNARNLLESYVSEEYSESYTYNAFGLLSSIQQNNVTTTLTWDILNGDGVVISAAKNGEVTDYTYGVERISAHSKGMRTEYVTDITGSVIAEVSSRFLNTEVTTKEYTPFGETETSGFGFKGEYYNADTGMIYLRARFYEPSLNRFSQKDSVRGTVIMPESLNRYVYCANDPVNLIDPSGRTWSSAVQKLKNVGSNIASSFKANPVKTVVAGAAAVATAITHPIATAVAATVAVGSFVAEVCKPAQPASYTPPVYLPSYGGSSTSGRGSSGGGGSDPDSDSGGSGGGNGTQTPAYYSYAQSGNVVQNVLSSPVVCKGLATVVSISSLVNSFKYGKLAGIDEHVLQPLLDIYGTAEYIATKKTTSADKLQDKLDKRIENYKDSAGNVTLYNIGRISASVDMLALSIAAIVLSGGSAAPAAGETALAASGEILLAVSASEAEIAAALAKATATIAAIGSAANLGSDIKEAESSSPDKKADDGKELPSSEDNPESYLEKALNKQELENPSKEIKETWTEGDYKYEVRIHEGEAEYTDSDSIYRVSRKSQIRDSNGQGTGTEYLGSDGNWYHESVLREFNKDGSINPLYNETAARITHIPLS